MAEPEQLSMFHDRILEEALKARDEFLKEQPHLQAYQDEINRILEKTIGFENRMAVLAFLMEAKLYELRESIANLRSSVPKLDEILGRTEAGNADKQFDSTSQHDGYLN